MSEAPRLVETQFALTQKPREQRGSRARCLAFTDGTDAEVAKRLTDLVAPYAHVDPQRHHWMPRGHQQPAEAKLGESPLFLGATQREAVTSWWLAVRNWANTPNWDIVSTATIEDQEGLILVEAKAHERELTLSGKPLSTTASNNSHKNHQHITGAISEANTALNAITPGWNLSPNSHYQLANRFAWSWKVASLGVPVILVYLGFLRAEEMSDCGRPLADAADWERVMLAYSQDIVPDAAWQQKLIVLSGSTVTPLQALIRSV